MLIVVAAALTKADFCTKPTDEPVATVKFTFVILELVIVSEDDAGEKVLLPYVGVIV